MGRSLTKKLQDVRGLIVEAYGNGVTIRELAHVYNVAPGTIRTRLLEAGITLRSRGRRKKEK